MDCSRIRTNATIDVYDQHFAFIHYKSLGDSHFGILPKTLNNPQSISLIFISSINDRSLKNIFELALEEKSKTENPNPKTITRLKYDFERFIDDTFAKKDIQNITRVELQEYTQTMVHTLHPTYEAFKKYKGVLNVAFSYALLNGIITVNPVAHIKNKVFQKSCAISDKSPEAKIHSQEELNVIKAEIRKRMHYKSYNGYFSMDMPCSSQLKVVPAVVKSVPLNGKM